MTASPIHQDVETGEDLSPYELNRLRADARWSDLLNPQVPFDPREGQSSRPMLWGVIVLLIVAIIISGAVA